MQCALGAVRILRSAVVLAGVNDQGVEFIVQRRVGGKVALEEMAEVFVTAVRFAQAMTFEQAPRVGVNDEDRMVAGVEQDGVGGFRPDAVDREQLFAQRRGWHAEHFGERAVVLLSEKADECFQFLRFLAEVAGRADELGEFGEWDCFDRAGLEELRAVEVGDGRFDVGPRGVLDQDSADDDLEAGSAGPPVLRTVGGEEGVVVGVERR